ncbi:MAG TPA: carbohydrate binding domain-containing protein, partial [Aggregatilineales bacterium]|nr:carbohydrate binding domain-containing protein [Aggregatilineales bacterium]
FLYDSNGDGAVDDPAALDAAWRTGVLHELNTFRTLMPNAIMSGHAMDISDPEIAALFNGISIGFAEPYIIEGKSSFRDLWDQYAAWQTIAQPPRESMIESAVPTQIGYGYGYKPLENMPPSTLEFARTFYPYMRFGLALTLMNDGYFAHEIGDSYHGNDWWYDELNFDLGYPLGPAQFIAKAGTPAQNILTNGSFDRAALAPWTLQITDKPGNAATLTRDLKDKVDGAASARIDIVSTSGADWKIDFSQPNRQLIKDTTYNVVFWAKSDRVRPITLYAQKNGPDWRNYGLNSHVTIGTQWKEYTVPFTATETASDARIHFFVGEQMGSVWIDNVRVVGRPPDIMRRDFTNGIVLLNASNKPQTISVGAGYQRLTGDQAPAYQYIIDDSTAAFSARGDWAEVTYDSGLSRASGPYFHSWGKASHKGTHGTVTWNLSIPHVDIYTLSVWWPAAPSAAEWNASVTYNVISNGKVVASATLNQRSSGDQWHQIADVPLAPGTYVQMTCQGGAPCIADALYVSSHARYNNGAVTRTVTLQPMDGIILQRSH